MNVAVLFCLDGLQYEFSVAHENIVRGRRVLLKLVVRPARFMGLVVPLCQIHLAAAVELVAPKEIVAFELRCLRFRFRGRCSRRRLRLGA